MSDNCGLHIPAPVRAIYEDYENSLEPSLKRAVRACAIPVRLNEELALRIFKTNYVGCNGDSKAVLEELVELPFISQWPDGTIKYSASARNYFDGSLREELDDQTCGPDVSYAKLNHLIAGFFHEEKERISEHLLGSNRQVRQLVLNEVLHEIPADAVRAMEELSDFVARSPSGCALSDALAANNIIELRRSYVGQLETFDALFINARILYERCQYLDAKPLLEKIYDSYMQLKYVHATLSKKRMFLAAISMHFLGFIFVKECKYPKAIKVLLESANLGYHLQENFHTIVALTTLGNAYVQSRKYPDAVRVLEEALGLKPDDQSRTMILNTLGNAYVQSRKYPDAVRVLEEALGLKPDDQQRAMILTTLGNAYVQSRKYPDAVRVLEEALELKPDDQSRAMILNTLGNAYTNNGNYSMAKPALTEALDISLAKKLIRSASTAYLFMAQMYERFGELKSAFDTYNKGAEWDEHHNNEQPATKKRAAAAKLKDKF